MCNQLALVLTLIVAPQTSIQNKFIISVGWDRRAYVWRDTGHFAKNHGYLMRIPDDDGSTGHTDDVLCVAFCPPNIIATGGYDGFLFLWSINSKYVMSCVVARVCASHVCGRRGVLAQFDMSAPVEALSYIKKIDMLCASTAKGWLYFISSRTTP